VLSARNIKKIFKWARVCGIKPLVLPTGQDNVAGIACQTH